MCAVFWLDFRKAFDSVPHLPLMKKLHSLEFHEILICWLNNYLAGRSQVVVVNGSESSEAAVLSGVPQGSSCIGSFTVSDIIILMIYRVLFKDF